jgi:hypothetical protein
MIDVRSLVGDIFSGKIKDERLALLANELQASERKLSGAEAKVKSLESQNSDLQVQLQEAQALLKKLQAQKHITACPYCGSEGNLQNLADIPGLEPHGLKQGYYQCSNPQCKKKYDKQVKL